MARAATFSLVPPWKRNAMPIFSLASKHRKSKPINARCASATENTETIPAPCICRSRRSAGRRLPRITRASSENRPACRLTPPAPPFAAGDTHMPKRATLLTRPSRKLFTPGFFYFRTAGQRAYAYNRLLGFDAGAGLNAVFGSDGHHHFSFK